MLLKADIAEKWIRYGNRRQARKSALAPAALGFVTQPEPRSIGSFARGRQIIAGNFLFAGHLVEAKDAAIWDLPIPDTSYEEALHGFSWLSDLAAVGDPDARLRAQAWVQLWIARFGKGRGAGWTPDLTGRRLIAWVNHAVFLLNGVPKEASVAYFKSLAHQVDYLSKRASYASVGLPRFEALSGLIYGGLSLSGLEAQVAPAIAQLAEDCEREIDASGGIKTRNPEELLEVLTLLLWAERAIFSAGIAMPVAIKQAIERIVPTLRALRHSDGSLARFHGGGRGLEGRLDGALASVRVALADVKSPMGFTRLQGGRTSVIMDTACPPSGETMGNGHASSLAFELTSGRRPLVVNAGSGANFGMDWHKAGRASASHSTVVVDGMSSSRLGRTKSTYGGKKILALEVTPKFVDVTVEDRIDRQILQAGHNGYQDTHGLVHARDVTLYKNGRGIEGADILATVSDEDRLLFDQAVDRAGFEGVPFALHFHLHPDVSAELDMNGKAVSLALKSGEIWVFRHDGQAKLSIEQGAYLEKDRLKPRVTKQVVLKSVAVEYASRIKWSFAKAQDTPTHLRDTA